MDVLLFLLPWIIILLALPLVAIARTAFHAYRKWRFCRQQAGRCFLIATRRRGWYEFVLNNVVPVLPADASCVWAPRSRSWRWRPRPVRPQVLAVLGLEAVGVRKPYAVVVGPRDLWIVPMHTALLPLKRFGASAESVQRSVLQVMTEVMAAAASGPYRRPSRDF